MQACYSQVHFAMGPRRNSAKAFAAFNYTNLEAFEQWTTDRTLQHPGTGLNGAPPPVARISGGPSPHATYSASENIVRQPNPVPHATNISPTLKSTRAQIFDLNSLTPNFSPSESVTGSSDFQVSRQYRFSNSPMSERFVRHDALLTKRKSNSVDIPLHNMNLRANSTTNMSSSSLQLETPQRKNSLQVPSNFEVETWFQEFYGQGAREGDADPFDELLDSKLLDSDFGTETRAELQVVNSQPMKKCNSPSQQHNNSSLGKVTNSPMGGTTTPLLRSQSSTAIVQQLSSSTSGAEQLKRSPTSRSLPLRHQRKSSKPRQRRLKWSVVELYQLWNGIREHGNEWREVESSVENRTYHQIKDKGRRLLQTERWVTGKTKKDTENAKQVAKDIAQAVLQRYETTGKLSRDDDDEAFSNGSTDDGLDVQDSLYFSETASSQT